MIEKEEFIGKDVEISYNGKKFKGKIVDETRNTVHLKTQTGLKKIVKKNSTFQIKNEKIEGRKINKRPEDRIKEC